MVSLLTVSGYTNIMYVSAGGVPAGPHLITSAGISEYAPLALGGDAEVMEI